MSNARFLIRVERGNHQAEVWINDIPVVFLRQGESPAPVIIPVNQFLVTGTNRIGVTVHSALVPGEADKAWPVDEVAAQYNGPSSVLVTIARYSPEQTGSADYPPALATLRWQGNAVTSPHHIEQEFTHDAKFPAWGWESAPAFRLLDNNLRLRVLAYLKSLHDMLVASNFEAFVAESALKLEEMTTHAYGVPAATMRQDMLAAMRDHSVAPNELQPLDENTIDMRLVAGGRMVECVRRDRTHVLKFVNRETGDEFFFPLMIGVIGDRFKVLR